MATAMESLGLGVFDSLADHVVVVDAQGLILAVNRAWRRFAADNDAPWLGHAVIGGDYLAVCDDALARDDDRDAGAVAAGLRALLAGSADHFELEYPCHAPGQQRWFQLRITPLRGPCAGAVLAHRDISARKLVELELRDNQARTKLMIRGANIGLWEWDLRTEALRIAPEWARSLGYEPSELPARIDDWAGRVHPLDLAAVQAAVISCRKGRWPETDVEFRIRHRDGSWRWMLARARFLRDPAGAAIRVIGCHFDISERRRAEEALRESEERFKNAFEHSAIGMALISAEGRWLKVNPRISAMLGYSEAELAALTFQEITHPDDLAGDLEQVQRILAGEIDTFTMPKRYLHRDGRVVWGLLAVAVIRGSAGAPPYFVSQISDISEQVRAEALRIDGEARLRESAEHLHTILENMAEGVVTIDPEGITLTFNRAASEMFGYAAAEVIGNNVAMLMPEPYRSHHDGYLQQTHRAHESRVIGRTRELQGRRRDGSLFPMSLAVSKILRSGRAFFIGVIRDITTQRRHEAQIHRLAFYDPLTGLANRRLLIERLAHARETSTQSGHHGAVMFLDLDHFKLLNDTLGHDMGDRLLRQVAVRLSACVREGDTVVRLGGDEFVVLLEGLSVREHEAATQAEAIAAQILGALARPYDLDGRSHLSTPSIGIVLFARDRETVDELLKKADVAMYQAKAMGRNAVRFFDPVMQAAVAARAQLEDDIRRGLADREFVLHYQVQVDRAGEVTGVEALVRWQSPSRGLVGPAEFISLAEETGLILPLGEWVLGSACAQLVAWADDPLRSGWTVAVNVSASQIAGADLAAIVGAALRASGADPRRLELELTESTLVGDMSATIATLSAIKASGVGLSLDDFGTGYSSLSYLKQLPLDQLKIDRSFVRDILTNPSDAVIARTIVALGHSLGLTVIAEGVESAEQRDFLADIGCDGFQGYYFGRPGPAEEAALGRG